MGRAMFVVDDILTAPARGLLWVFQELHAAIQQDMEGQAEDIMHELTELYMQLETGQITEAEFDARETGLLDRLDRLQDEENASGTEAPEDAEEENEQP